MRLGRDNDALTNAERMAESGYHNGLVMVYLAWLAAGAEQDLPRTLHFCIPLWIASGRDVPALRRAVEAHADTVELSPALNHALTAEDNARAFARLGAETRAFLRAFLRSLYANDLLAQFPPNQPKPSPETRSQN